MFKPQCRRRSDLERVVLEVGMAIAIGSQSRGQGECSKDGAAELMSIREAVDDSKLACGGLEAGGVVVVGTELRVNLEAMLAVRASQPAEDEGTEERWTTISDTKWSLDVMADNCC